MGKMRQLNKYYNLVLPSVFLLPAKDTKVTLINCLFCSRSCFYACALVVINNASVTKVSGHMCIAKHLKKAIGSNLTVSISACNTKKCFITSQLL